MEGGANHHQHQQQGSVEDSFNAYVRFGKTERDGHWTVAMAECC